MKLVWISNAPFINCGYGSIVRNLLPSINQKHPSALITNYGIEGGQKMENAWNGITFYGAGQAQGHFEEGLVPNHYTDFSGDALITIFDVWIFRELPRLIQQNNIPWIPYVPIDGDDMNPYYLEVLKSAFKIIPMSKHSENCLKKYFPEKTLPFIPPGINTEIYKPLWNSEEEKNKLKREHLGVDEDSFVISLMGDIKGLRMRWAENIEGISIFKKRHPEIKMNLYVHTNMRAAAGANFPIPMLLEKFDLNEISRQVDTYDYVKGVSDYEMAEIYNSSDVLLQCAYGHGWGMMMVEAAACGTPSITTNFTSMPEVCKHGETGYLVNPLFLEYDPTMARKAVPNPEEIANYLELIYEKKSSSFKENCVNFAQQFSWENIITQWEKTLQESEIQIEREVFKIPTEYSEELKKRAQSIFVVGQ